MYKYLVEFVDDNAALDDHIIGLYDTFETAKEILDKFAYEHDIKILEHCHVPIDKDWETWEYFFNSMDDNCRFVINKIRLNAPSLI